MDTEQFRKHGKEMVDYICEYLETIKQRRVTPTVNPGWLKNKIPLEAPVQPESFDAIMKDVENIIMPGVTHWQHPRFHAYFPSGNSFPSILADMLSDSIACIGFSWAASPSCTELETIVLDWLGKAIGLPEEFLTFSEEASKTIDSVRNDDSETEVHNGKGGGVLQSSASECIFVCMLAARAQAIKRLRKLHPFVEEGVLLSKLMAYCSKESHSCVEKGAMMAFVKLRILEPDENNSLRGATLRQVMEQDEAMGLIPFFVSTTLGTTSCCSFDNIPEIGLVCQQFETVWLHVDAAYAGSAFICPEFRSLMNGVQYADSFNLNTNKWLLTNFDCSCLWVKDRFKLTCALVVDPLYLQHGYAGAVDYRHWGIPLSRRFRSLKLWFVLRTYGISGLQKYIRHHCQLAKRFERLVRSDNKYEVLNDVKMGLVCFRLKDDPTNKLNKKLLETINESGKLHMVPSLVHDKYVIRFCVVAEHATEDDIDYAWKIIKETAVTVVYNDQELTEKREEQVDEVFELSERKKKDDLAYRRSFFVRMVSDPKIYNPIIARSSPGSRRHTHLSSMDDDIHDPLSTSTSDSEDTMTQPASSWISWPLAFLFQGVFDDKEGSNDVPVRFRHLATKMHFKSKSKSPEHLATEESKSRRNSPVFPRKSSYVKTENESNMQK
ncbi:tyrosine decarboxylase [Myzus persicae]|uniref:tyrosine decarboxylase n=1 Tax=Myzus persicae TaxID=13164 RepID=UPI000B934CC5|nr:tyrosine decarboxylase [Myzus persicae]XP_022162187.1 tyrosine decarboxylase [Myzus persicae]